MSGFVRVLQDAGVRPPSQEQVVRVLGEDGGAACEDPGNALRKANLFAQLTNGASGPGTRPVLADSRAVRGELLIVSIYCPEELQVERMLRDRGWSLVDAEARIAAQATREQRLAVATLAASHR